MNNIIYHKNIRYFLKRVLQVLSVLIPVMGLYLLYQPQIHLGDYTITNYFFPRFKWWQCLVIYFIFLNTIGVIIFTILSVYYTSKRTRNQRLIPRLSNVFNNLVVEYLYDPKYQITEERQALMRKLKHFTKRKLHIEAFFIAITKIQETIAMNHSNDFKELLSELNLNTYIDHFLFSYNLSDRILAMRIISYLRINKEEYNDRIYKYSDSKNYALRSEAYGALIRMMEGDNQLAEFIGNKYNLSLFDINTIVNAVIKNHKMNIDYIDFLSSKLNRKIIVGLMLAKYRYRKGSRSLILILNYIGNEDPLLNQLAWESFLELVPKKEGVDIILDRFEQEPDPIKLMILEKSYDTADQQFYKFLQEIINTNSLIIKIEAIKILFNEQFEYILPLVNSNDPEVRMALQEITDLNINQ